jgi:hypothetical protein
MITILLMSPLYSKFQLEELRTAVASALSLPLASSSEELGRLKLVKSGVALTDDASIKSLKEGGEKTKLLFSKEATFYLQTCGKFLKSIKKLLFLSFFTLPQILY